MDNASILRRCKRCEKELPIDNFERTKYKGEYKNWSWKCKPCLSKIAIANRIKRTSTPEGLARHKALKDANNRKRSLDPVKSAIKLKKDRGYQKRKYQPKISNRIRKQRQEWMDSGRLTKTEALRYWFNEAAPDDWITEYYKDRPWSNPRLSSAETYRLRYKLDPQFNCAQRIKNIARQLVNGERFGMSKTLGYSSEELKRRLESRFTEGMNWERFLNGEIHIDHIIPKVFFDHSDSEETRDCWSLANLQPLWAKHNWSKNSRVIPSQACPKLWGKYGHRCKQTISEL